MKIFTLLLLLFSLRAFALVGTASVGTAIINPGTSTVMAPALTLNSGSANASPSANWQVVVLYSCSVASLYQLNTLNVSSAIVSSVNLYCAANTTNILQIPGISFPIPQGFKLNVTNSASFTGTGQVAIYAALEAVN